MLFSWVNTFLKETPWVESSRRLEKSIRRVDLSSLSPQAACCLSPKWRESPCCTTVWGAAVMIVGLNHLLPLLLTPFVSGGKKRHFTYHYCYSTLSVVHFIQKGSFEPQKIFAANAAGCLEKGEARKDPLLPPASVLPSDPHWKYVQPYLLGNNSFENNAAFDVCVSMEDPRVESK